MKRSGELRAASAWVALSALALLGGSVGCSRPTNQPAAPEPQAESAAPSGRAASPSYVVRAVQESAAGTISGRVLYSGKPLAPKRFAVTRDASICGDTKEIYPVKIEQGGVADAVVWIDDITSGKEFNFPDPVIDQKKCGFVPDLLLMKPGKLRVVNTDLCLHNIHVFAHANRQPNNAMPPGATPVEITLMRPDLVAIRCDVHTWMKAYVIVAMNPYYVVTGRGGSFRLGGVPAGHYHLKVWQENLGELDQQITVEPAKTAEANFTYTSGTELARHSE